MSESLDFTDLWQNFCRYVARDGGPEVRQQLKEYRTAIAALRNATRGNDATEQLQRSHAQAEQGDAPSSVEAAQPEVCELTARALLVDGGFRTVVCEQPHCHSRPVLTVVGFGDQLFYCAQHTPLKLVRKFEWQFYDRFGLAVVGDTLYWVRDDDDGVRLIEVDE